MGFVMPHITILIGMCAVGVALLFQIIGLATPGWIVFDKGDIESGFWKICNGGRCVNYAADVESWLEACRAFGILGIFAMAASAVAGLLICLMSERKAIFTLVAPAASAAGAFCAMLEFAIFAGENSEGSEYFGYSFALTVVAFVLCLGATALFIFGKLKFAE